MIGILSLSFNGITLPMERSKYVEASEIEKIRNLEWIHFPLLDGVYWFRTAIIALIYVIICLIFSNYTSGILQVLFIIGVPVGFIWYIYKILFGSNFVSTHTGIFYEIEAMSSLKREIFTEYDALFSSMKLDIWTSWVDPKMIMKTKEWIQLVSRKIQEYTWVFDKIAQQKKHLFIFYHPFDYLNLIKLLIYNEKKAISNLALELSFVIKSWTTLHQKELLEVEQELEKQVITTESISGQWAIDLQRVRLHEHIENLNKITNTL